MLTDAQYATLKSEIQNDPNGYGYAPLVQQGSDNLIKDLLNLKRAAIQVRRTDVSGKELLEAINLADYPALPGSPNAAQLSKERRELAWLTSIVGLARVRLLNEDDTDTPVVANLKTMFPSPPGSPTRTRIIALAKRDGSRAEQLLGLNIVLTDEDIANARNAP